MPVMKLLCTRCKKERTFTDSEIIDIGVFISDKNLLVDSIPRYVSLLDGYTCSHMGCNTVHAESGQPHDYTFDEDFIKEIAEETDKLKDLKENINITNDDINKIMHEANDLVKRAEEFKIQLDALQSDYNVKAYQIAKSTGMPWSKWL